MSTIDDGGPAFPAQVWETEHGDRVFPASGGTHGGMSLRDWFAGQALANPAICTGTAPQYDIERWFNGRGGVRREEIAAKQASIYADAMLAARKGGHDA